MARVSEPCTSPDAPLEVAHFQFLNGRISERGGVGRGVGTNSHPGFPRTGTSLNLRRPLPGHRGPLLTTNQWFRIDLWV